MRKGTVFIYMMQQLYQKNNLSLHVEICNNIHINKINNLV